MRNSTGSPVFSDFQSDLSRVAVSRPLVKGNEDAGYEGGRACEARKRLSAFHTTTVGFSYNEVVLSRCRIMSREVTEIA